MTAVAEGAALFAESIEWGSQTRGRKSKRGKERRRRERGMEKEKGDKGETKENRRGREEEKE